MPIRMRQTNIHIRIKLCIPMYKYIFVNKHGRSWFQLHDKYNGDSKPKFAQFVNWAVTNLWYGTETNTRRKYRAMLVRSLITSVMFLFHRLMWTSIVIITTVAFVYQCQDLVRLYMRRPVRITMTMSQQTPVVFPAITICNQNAFRYPVWTIVINVRTLFPFFHIPQKTPDIFAS